ncbi:MAG: substrate-binding domain-containing protein [Burkholderiales bacterium]
MRAGAPKPDIGSADALRRTLLPVPGIAHITPLPPELQKVSTFAAGIAASCPNQSLARTVIEFLASPQAADAIRNSGLQTP